MQIGIESNIIVLKLTNDEDVFQSIENAVKTHKIRSGIIITGIGMLKEFELGYFNPDGYKTKFFTESFELVSMMGSIAYSRDEEAKFLPHIHCSVADRNHQVFGGHLNKGRVNVVNEITLLRLDELKLNRVKNESTNLMELNIES
jgi:predicted DNA-binding protein with PD1-like motif